MVNMKTRLDDLELVRDVLVYIKEPKSRKDIGTFLNVRKSKRIEVMFNTLKTLGFIDSTGVNYIISPDGIIYLVLTNQILEGWKNELSK